jgi:NADH-quinone oxidoreductase subunit G
MNTKVKFIGALTNKPSAFKARNWELECISSIDVFDIIGCNITIDSLNAHRPMRVLSKINNHLNQEWISDRIRFIIDAYTRSQNQELKLQSLIKVEKKQERNCEIG